MKIAVLALQGAFAEHRATLARLGVDSVELRQAGDLDAPFDGLILPGGESTVMGKLLRELRMLDPLRQRIAGGMPVFGTCAGLILLAKAVDGGQPVFATLDAQAKRNAYGRQLGSFETQGEFAGIGTVPMTFIRAPYLASVGPQVRVLAQVDGKIVAARQGNQLVCAFHPELTQDDRVHQYFLNMA